MYYAHFVFYHNGDQPASAKNIRIEPTECLAKNSDSAHRHLCNKFLLFN